LSVEALRELVCDELERARGAAGERETIKSRAGFHWRPKIASPK